MSASPPVLSPAGFPANALVTPRCSACTKAAPLQCSGWLQGAWNYCSETYRGFVWIVPLLKSASIFLFRYTLKCMHITCLLWTKANKTWTLAQARAKPNLAHSLLHPATIQYSGLSPLHCLFLGGFFFFFSPEHAKSNASDGTWGTAVPLQLIAQLTDYPQIIKVRGSAPSEMGTCVFMCTPLWVQSHSEEPPPPISRVTKNSINWSKWL